MTTIRLMGILKGEEKEKRIQNLFKPIKLDPRIQEANRTLNYLNKKPKTPLQRHIILKLQKVNVKEF